MSIRDLAKSYGSVHAVRGITFDVERGEIFGSLGLNGAGKTTTIRILLDLLRPSRGSARLFGFDCRQQSRLTRALVGYMPGELGFYPDMTGLELLDLMARLSGVAIGTGHRLELVDRLELARADLRRPLRLDPLVQRALHELLFELRARGCTVFMSSHVLSEVERLCDRIGVIRNGQMVLLAIFLAGAVMGNVAYARRDL